MELPYTFAGLKPCSPARARAAVLPVAWDGTTSWQPGARFGPAAIVMASRFLEHYDEALDSEPAALGIITRPELWPDLASPGRAVAAVEKKVAALFARGLFPVTLGGEHAVTIGCARAARRFFPEVSFLILDAHADLRPSWQGSRFNHACVSRRCLETGRPVTLMGIRSMESGDAAAGKKTPGLTIHTATALRAGGDWPLPGGDPGKPLYLSIDLDFFDPSVVPAVGTPEPGGFGWSETSDFLRRLGRQRRIIGCDITELNGAGGDTASAFLAARLAYRLIGLGAGDRGPANRGPEQ